MQLLEQIKDNIRNHYVLVDEVENVIATLEAQKADYANLTDSYEIAQTLTRILREITGDLHFAVMYQPETGQANGQTPSPYFGFSQRNNYHFQAVKRLTGNIGYLDLRMFSGSPEALDIGNAAMTFLANTDAIIFDIRKNRGGGDPLIQLFLSYLFKEKTLINTFYNRDEDNYTESWTSTDISGKCLPDIPVYVLTSGSTGSAAEEFAYDLQQLKRATIIGETTAGAGHTVGMYPISDGFRVLVPNGRPINPVSGKDWQGVGVIPDIESQPEDALKVAHLLALETLAESAEDDFDATYYQWECETSTADYTPYPVEDLSAYTGNYEGRQILVKDGKLRYESPNLCRDLTAIKQDIFALMDDLRLHFEGNKIHLCWRDNNREQSFTRSTE